MPGTGADKGEVEGAGVGGGDLVVVDGGVHRHVVGGVIGSGADVGQACVCVCVCMYLFVYLLNVFSFNLCNN